MDRRYWKQFKNEQIFADFHQYIWRFSGFNILKVIFKSNSLSINKKNQINIKCSLLNKTLSFIKIKIFSIQLWRKLIKLYPMTDYNLQTIEIKYNFSEIIYHVQCPWILKWFAKINDSTPLSKSKKIPKTNPFYL